MAVIADDFFQHFDDFFNYRRDVYEISPQTVKSNRVDLDLFKNFICSQTLVSHWCQCHIGVKS